MSIVTWDIKVGDMIEVYSHVNKCNTTVKVIKEPNEERDQLWIVFEEEKALIGRYAIFSKKHQRWDIL